MCNYFLVGNKCIILLVLVKRNFWTFLINAQRKTINKFPKNGKHDFVQFESCYFLVINNYFKFLRLQIPQLGTFIVVHTYYL